MKKTLSFSVLCMAFYLGLIGQSLSEDKMKPPLPELPKVEAEAGGLSADSIQKMIELIQTTPPNDFRGVVVIKEGKLLVEEYFNTYWRASIHDIRSAAKSITALLMGIAIDKGLVESADQSVYDFFPSDTYPAPPSPEHKEIKIKHLLNMRSGMAADTNDPNSPGYEGNWIAKDDWIKYILQLPMDTAPGTQWVYTDVSALLIGAIIEEVSGQTLAEFAEENLFAPLGIQEYYWYKSAKNRTGAMGNLYLATLDFAKIGQVVLNKGKWGNKQIISEKWIREIEKKRVDISETNPYAKDYGYFWYKSEKSIGDKTYEYLFAAGNGGNYLIVIPAQKMVVSLTSSAYGPGLGHPRSNNIFSFILGALVE